MAKTEETYVDVGTCEMSLETGGVKRFDYIAVPSNLADKLKSFLRERGVESLGCWHQTFHRQHFELFAPDDLDQVQPLARDFWAIQP